MLLLPLLLLRRGREIFSRRRGAWTGGGGYRGSGSASCSCRGSSCAAAAAAGGGCGRRAGRACRRLRDPSAHELLPAFYDSRKGRCCPCEDAKGGHAEAPGAACGRRRCRYDGGRGREEAGREGARDRAVDGVEGGAGKAGEAESACCSVFWTQGRSALIGCSEVVELVLACGRNRNMKIVEQMECRL